MDAGGNFGTWGVENQVMSSFLQAVSKLTEKHRCEHPPELGSAAVAALEVQGMNWFGAELKAGLPLLLFPLPRFISFFVGLLRGWFGFVSTNVKYPKLEGHVATFPPHYPNGHKKVDAPRSLFKSKTNKKKSQIFELNRADV